MVTPMYGVSESIICCSCDGGSDCASLEDAIHKGWTELDYDDGASWYYMGLCPDCKREIELIERRHALEDLARKRHLIENGWRAANVRDACDYMWVDPRGGDLIDFAHAFLIQEHRDGKFSHNTWEQDENVALIKLRLRKRDKEAANQ